MNRERKHRWISIAVAIFIATVALLLTDHAILQATSQRTLVDASPSTLADGLTFSIDITATNVLTGVTWSSVAWGDYDNDGDLDILLAGMDGSSNRIASVYKNTNGAFTVDITATNVLTGVDGSRSSVAWGDYDNDGDLDILLTGYDGSNRVASVYQNMDGAFTVDITTTNVLTGVSGGGAVWGDYDNDGDLDILLTGYAGPSNYIASVYKNTDGVFMVDSAATDVLTGVMYSSVAWGDYDNDGDLDILLTGYDSEGNRIASVYQNTDGMFSVDVTATNVLTGVSWGSAVWGDYDNDGDLDILLTGSTGGGNCTASVYQNTNGAFTVNVTSTNALTDVWRSNVAWGDYDNDGDLDILLTGYNSEDVPIASVYQNTDGAFMVDTTATNVLTGVSAGSAAWGDYDNDGDLDILLTGYAGPSNYIASVYRNNTVTANTPPSAPTGLNVDVAGRTVELRWSAASDNETPAASLHYNLWVGTEPGNVDVVSPMAFTTTNPFTSGLRLLPALGNAQHGLTATLKGLPPGTYYWSVQAIDHTFAGSSFASEGSFKTLALAISVPTNTESTLTYTDTQGSPTIIHVPAGTVTEAITLVYTPVETATVTSGFSFAGHAFDLEAYRNSALLPNFAFEKPVTVTVHYSEADVAGLDEATLELRYWNGSAWVMDGITLVERNTTQKYVCFTIAHLSKFALFASEPNQEPYVPSNPVPTDGANNVPTNRVLSWQGGDPDDDPITCTIAISTSGLPLVVDTTTLTYYAPSLITGTIYHWVITVTDGISTVVGPTWSFTTAVSIEPFTGHIIKSVMPKGPVNYGDEITYTLVISAEEGTQVTLYDRLEGTSWTHFVGQPPVGIIHVNGVITGTLAMSTDWITVSFVAQVGVPGTAGITVTVTNSACIHSVGETLDDCVWSNEVTNSAFQPYSIYLPMVLRNH